MVPITAMSPDRSEPQITCRTCGADITAHARHNRGWTQCPACYRKRQIMCRSCGADITEHAQYNRRWTQCSVCYWKGRLDHQKPLEDVLRRRSDVRGRLEALRAEIQRTEATIKHHAANPPVRFPWWRKLLGTPRDEVLDGHRQRSWELQADLRRLEDEQSRLEMQLQNAKKVKKRFLDAQVARNAAEAKNRLKAQEHERFCSEAFSNLDGKFERTQFFIQPRDYRRGNAIDNYFRNELSDVVIAAFGHCCVFCGARDDLTFDHYGLPKNEGGNFVLILADKASIRVNIVVLCRGCNAVKGQKSHSFHFSDAQQEQATACQRALLESLLRDHKFLSLIKKWCS